jgi:RIO-like serine/threonine protein kinase
MRSILSGTPKLFRSGTTDVLQVTTTDGALENILECSNNGTWVAIEEIVRQSGITPIKTMEILGFLSKFEFIAFDSDKKAVKLIDLGKRFIKLPDS